MQEKHKLSLIGDPASLSSEHLWKSLYKMIPAQVYPAGADLFRQGGSAQEVYFIDSGLIKLVCLNEDGGQTIVGLRSRGGILGAAAVMVNKPHPVSAVTLSNCGARCFPAAGFRHLLQTTLNLPGCVFSRTAWSITSRLQA